MKVNVPLNKAYKLLGNGPVVMVSSSFDGSSDVMTNAWNCALDFNPSRVLLVLSSESVTRRYAEKSGELIINIPSAAQKELLQNVGSCHGDVCDKFTKFNIEIDEANVVHAPQIKGCLGWLECRIIPEHAIAKYDILLCEVVSASAEDYYFRDNNIVVSSDLKESCIHHAGDANFYTMGKLV